MVIFQAAASMLIASVVRVGSIGEKNHIRGDTVPMILVGGRIVGSVTATASGQRGVLEDLELTGRHTAVHVHGIATAKEHVSGHVRLPGLGQSLRKKPYPQESRPNSAACGNSSSGSGFSETSRKM